MRQRERNFHTRWVWKFGSQCGNCCCVEIPDIPPKYQLPKSSCRPTDDSAPWHWKGPIFGLVKNSPWANVATIEHPDAAAGDTRRDASVEIWSGGIEKLGVPEGGGPS